MRHRNKTKKLGRTRSHRRATLRNLSMAIVQNKQIKTTLVKAKVARSLIEKLITTAKQDTVAARRQVFKWLQNHQLVKKLFEEIAPTYADRNGGYSRVIKLGRRQGDGAELAILQLVGFEPVVVEKTSEKKKKKAAPAKKETVTKEEPEAQVEEKAEEKAEEVKEKAAEKKPKKEAKVKEEKEKKATAKEEKPKEKSKAAPKKAEPHEKAGTKKKTEKTKSAEHKKEKK